MMLGHPTCKICTGRNGMAATFCTLSQTSEGTGSQDHQFSMVAFAGSARSSRAGCGFFTDGFGRGRSGTEERRT